MTSKLLINIFIFLLGSFLVCPVEATLQAPLKYWSIQCYKSRKIKDCITALTVLESLQNSASDKNNYQCQTYLLGIGSDLIMISLNDKRIDNPIKKLKSFSSFCY